MYSTKKKVSKLTNQFIFGPVIGIFGIIIFLIGYNSSAGFFESLGNSIHAVLMIVLGVIMFISSNKRINSIKGHSFEITENEIELYKFEDKQVISHNDLKDLKKGLKELEILTSNDESILIKLDDYSLTYEEKKELADKVEKLKETFSNK